MFEEDESPKPQPESLRHSWRKRLEKVKPPVEAASQPEPPASSETTGIPEIVSPIEKSALSVRRRLLASAPVEESSQKAEPESTSRFGRWRANLRYAMGQGPDATEPSEEQIDNTIGKWRQKIQSVQPMVDPEPPQDTSGPPGSWRDRLRFVKQLEEELPVAPDTGQSEILVVSAPIPDTSPAPVGLAAQVLGESPFVQNVQPVFPLTEPTHRAARDILEVSPSPEPIAEVSDSTIGLADQSTAGALGAPLTSPSEPFRFAQDPPLVATSDEIPSPVNAGLLNFLVQSVPDTETGNDGPQPSSLEDTLPKKSPAQPIDKDQIQVRPQPPAGNEFADFVQNSDPQEETGLARPLPPPPPPASPILRNAAGRLPRPTGAAPVAPKPVRPLELPEPTTSSADSGQSNVSTSLRPNLETASDSAVQVDRSAPSLDLAQPKKVAGFALSLPLEVPVVQPTPPPPPPAPPKIEPQSVAPAFKPLDDAAPGLVRPASRPSKLPTAASEGASRSTKAKPKYYKVDAQELSVFTRQLSTMIQSGITIHAALSFFGESGQPGQLTTVVGEIANKVCTGSKLSEGFRAFPEVFSPVYVGLVETAEASSRLDETLARLADLLENQNRLRQRLVSAITYPAFLLVASTAAIALFVYYILPMMGSLYQGLGITLPWPTRLLLQMRTILPMVVGLLATAMIAYTLTYQRIQAWLRKNISARRKLHGVLIHLPALGSMIEKMSISRVLYSFSTMLDAGLSFNEALRRCSAVAGNQIISDRLDRSRVDLVDGLTISECFSRNDVFPRACIQMLTVGEESASMNLMITYAAKYYESEVDCAIERFTALIEPTIMAGMGFFVGFIVLSAVLPTVKLIEAL